MQNLGRALAEFDLALENFDHPAAHRQHRWNLADVYQHEAKVSLIDEPGKRALLDWAFATWKAALPQLDDLPWQVIHGDAHDENVLVGGDEVVGLIDFGDCCYNPTVCELAICLAYMMMRGEAFHIARSIVRGYEGVRSLTPKERKVMYPLICGRLAASLCIANERKLIDPDHPNWFGGERRTWAHLQTLRQLGGRAFEARCMLPV